MKESPLISVIVPIYKVEQYLDKCIKSITNQTYKNLEIFLVDDGSPDRCGEMCDDYAKDDQRIIVIHKKNGGLSDARNAAIDVAIGDYIMFVDSDDWIELNACERIVQLFEQYQTDIVCFGLKFVHESGKKDGYFKTTDSRAITSSEGIGYIINYTGGVGNYACNKVYKHSLFHVTRYPVGKVYEDSGTTYKLFAQAKSIYVTDDVLYNYFIRKGSISEDKFNPKGFRDRLDLWAERLDFLKEHYPQHVNAQMALMVGEMQIALVILHNKPEYLDLKRYVEDFEKKYNPNVKVLKMYNKKIALYYYCRPIFNFLCKLLYVK